MRLLSLMPLDAIIVFLTLRCQYLATQTVAPLLLVLIKLSLELRLLIRSILWSFGNRVDNPPFRLEGYLHTAKLFENAIDYGHLIAKHKADACLIEGETPKRPLRSSSSSICYLYSLGAASLPLRLFLFHRGCSLLVLHVVEYAFRQYACDSRCRPLHWFSFSLDKVCEV